MNLRLIGGEMPVWSDLDSATGGPALTPLLAAETGRTLVAGPHDPALIDTLPTGSITLLVRGMPDAEALAARYADRPGVAVCCGTPDKLAAEEPFDTVVALDGVRRLSSAESDDLTWEAAFSLLVGLLRPGGTLLLGVENLIGLHRLAALPTVPSDADWTAAEEHDRSRPAGLAALIARLGAAGLEVAGAYAAYPAVTAPRALLGAELLDDEGVRGFVEAAVGRACAASDVDQLVDPVRLAVDSVRHGAAFSLAPGWVLVAHSGGPSPLGGILAEPGGWDEIRRRGDGSWARFRHGIGDGDVVAGGRTLRELIVDAATRRDVPALRELVGGWQGGDAAGVAADQVIVGPDGLSALVAAGDPDVALRELAASMTGAGLAHLFPPGDPAAALAVMAGRSLGPGPQPAARSLREVIAERDRLARELAESRAESDWYAEALTSRDDALKRAQRINKLLSGSLSARMGWALIGGAKAARRAVRRRLR
ncbi:hypothetical protein F4553_006189 [Allocatelliglobosispora scoriae]|uniref:Class I SAM-dependent methyltransferase n=1 Tax=Allocatelliglobosispora scoriae TaxID=643052 RepID=A0A841BYL0_9ACTN|nr:hypothetical protein [Allocatelliglobosispora scoriae]MBB5872755.1 hypothetical protein [Allocatelliglobosispora scoriae]